MLFIIFLALAVWPVTLGKQQGTLCGKGSVIFDHLQRNQKCKEICNKSSLKIIDSARSQFQLKIKEAIHIALKKPTLNKQIKHKTLNIAI